MPDYKTKPDERGNKNPERSASGQDHRRRPDERGKRNPEQSTSGRDYKRKPDERGNRNVERSASGRDHRRRPDERENRSPDGAVAALIELDHEIMKLLARRGTLVSRIREGKDQATSPAAIRAEKAVRIAWETGAPNFSKDPLFSRQLFNLLQDIKILNKQEAQNSAAFNLAPPYRPVSGTLAGPLHLRRAQMHIVLAAALGRELKLENLLLSAALSDTVKLCVQAGAAASCEHSDSKGLGRVLVQPGASLEFSGQSLFVGDDIFAFCLVLFIALTKPGGMRFNGGARLKAADLRVLRNFLPLLGARFYHIVPHSQGLPAGLEASGEVPDEIAVPADLPFEAICALLIAPLVWQKSLRIDLFALSTTMRDKVLLETTPLFQATGAHVERHETLLEYAPRELSLPHCPDLPLDPALSAFILVLPAFAGGGRISLEGKWPENTPEAVMAEGILRFAGLDLECDTFGISAQAVQNPSEQSLSCPDLSPELGPLFLAVCAKHLLRSQTPSLTEDFALFPRTDEDAAMAGEFFSRLGLYFAPAYLGRTPKAAAVHVAPESRPLDADSAREEGAFSASGIGAEDAILPATGKDIVQTFAWTSPTAYWGMAFALAAFLRPGLLLANPGNVTEKYPVFWSIYNSLPNPEIRLARPVERNTVSEDRPVRRRLLAD